MSSEVHIFAIMMTRRLMQTTESPFNSQPLWGFVAAVIVVVLLAIVVIGTWPDSQFGEPAATGIEVLRGSAVEIGKALVSPDWYVLPFEVVSVLLLAALVGAVVIAWPEKNS